MLGSEGSWWMVAVVTLLASFAALFLLWKHHPNYGANPGLPSFPVVGSVPLILLNKHRFSEWSCEVFERAHALTIRCFIGPLTVIGTADPQNVQHILKSQFEHYPKGPSFYPYFSDLLGVGIFNCDGSLWRFQRKVASHIFTSSSLKDFIMEIGSMEILRRLLPALDFACEQLPGHAIDLQALMMDFTFDTISQLTFGADPACLTSCKVIASHVNADMQRKQMGTKSDVQHVQADAHNKADAQHGDVHVEAHAWHDGTHTEPHVEHDNCISTSATGLGLHGKRDGQNVMGSTEIVSSQKRATTGPSYIEVPNDLIQGFKQGFPVALQITADRFLTPNFIWQTKRALKVGSEKKLSDALEAVSKFTSFVIEKNKCEVGYERKDLLSRFMRLSKPQVESLLEGEDEAAWKASNDQHGQTLSDSLLKNILLSFILAGRETVASGITFLMWLLCLHPRVEKAVHEEIERIVEDRRSNQLCATSGSNATEEMGTFSFEELKQMNYLQAALSESMRLYPPVPSNPKYAARDDVLPDGTQILKGNQVSYNVFAMGRAKKVWGEDCLEFRPERWIGEDGKFVPTNPYKYPVFQAGPRVCLGKDFAFIQMKLVVASLVQHFEFKLSSGFKPKLSFGATLTMTNGLPMTVKRRQVAFCV